MAHPETHFSKKGRYTRLACPLAALFLAVLFSAGCRPPSPQGKPRRVTPSPPVESITFEGKHYDLAQALSNSIEVLRTGDTEKKKRWLLKLPEFTTNLQESINPLLIKAYPTEPDGTVKEHILYVLSCAGDDRVVPLALTVNTHANPMLKLFASHTLITYGYIAGIDLLVNSLDDFSEDEQRRARITWEAAVPIFGFDFTWDKKNLPPDRRQADKIRNQQVVTWWKANRDKYKARGSN